MSLQLARMLAESLALQLATCPAKLCHDAAVEGMNPRLVRGLIAARDAFAQEVSENDAEELLGTITSEIKANLKDL